jgi:hypothetical protein
VNHLLASALRSRSINGLGGDHPPFPPSRLLDSSGKKAGELATGYRNGSD